MSDEQAYRRQDYLAKYKSGEWTREIIGRYGEYALFWTPNEADAESPNGFEFDCISLAEGYDFDDPTGGYEGVVHGVAYFDGLRHLYFGHNDDDEPGYLNYPDSQSLVELITRLHQLEGEYCWDAPQNREKKR